MKPRSHNQRSHNQSFQKRDNDNDNKSHKSAIVIIPPQSLWSTIQEIRAKHDDKFRRWMPHITMVYPFRHRRDFNIAAEKLTPVCAQIEPFSIELKTFKYFRHGREKHTMWLAPEPVPQLRTLQSALTSVFPDCDDVQQISGQFTPHLSVGQVQGADNLTKLLTELQSQWQPISFTVNEVNLIWRNDAPDDIFRIGTKVPLKTV